MYYKLYCEENNILIGKHVKVHPSPGSGKIELSHLDEIWAGDMHFYADSIRVQSSDIRRVETRSSRNEDDEEWKLLWQRDKPWCYEDDWELQNVLGGQK